MPFKQVNTNSQHAAQPISY